MSIFSETITKIDHIYDNVVKGFLLEREKISERLHKFLEEFENEQKLKNNRVKQTLTTTLQSINEDEDERDQIPIAGNTQSHPQKSNIVATQLPSDKGLPSTHNNKQLPKVQTENDNELSKTVSEIQSNDKVKRISKKRIKDEIDDPVSPEVDKRQKRSASVKAQSTINKMVNMPLNQKLRRDNTAEEQRSSSRRGKGRKDTEGNKENTSPPVIIKQEKISMPAEEPMDVEPLLTIEKKEPVSNSEMLPPPIPKPRRVVKDKSKDVSNETVENEEQAGRRSRARAKKQADAPPIPPVMRRSARVNSRANLTEDVSVQESPAPAQEGRPKRTKKKQLNEISNQSKEDSQQPLENGISREGTPEKPRPKRTRKVPQKYIDEQNNLKKDVSSSLEQENEKSKQSQENEKFKEPAQEVSKVSEQQPHIEKKDEIKIPEQQLNVPQSTKIPIPIGKSTNYLYDENVVSSPILQMSTKYNYKNKSKDLTLDKQEQDSVNEIRDIKLELEKTRMLNNERNVTITLNKLSEMNSTVVLPSSKFTHDPVTPKVVNKINETIVLQKPNTALPPTKAEQSCVMNNTMVLNKEGTPQSNVLTDDNSLLTDDNSEQEHTPPHAEQQEKSPPMSAVKEKVQQFEEMATRMTRTKTKALAKKVTEDDDNETPPNKGIPPKSALSVETLSKLNSLIFNGKPPVVSNSATKLKPNNISNLKSFIPGTSAIATPNAVAKAKEAADESSKKEKEDARKKKEALLQAKREERKRKREEKMAAAAAAREAAERERLLALEAARKERMEKQAHADLGKLERLKEAERKKQEQARKIAETEERRRAEEQARLQKLAEEQKRAEIARKKQQEEAEATKREVALATKELEKRKKEYIAKQKLQQRVENNRTNTPLRMPGTPGAPAPAMEPVHMADGFQYLNSDDDEDKPCKKLEPAWSTNKARLRQLRIQSAVKVEHIDRMFSVRRHTPDLREIFPMISRHALKRTSSAVWRTPPGLKLHKVPE